MKRRDIDAFSETILDEYGPTADIHALKMANRFLHQGDNANGEAWLRITDRIRELQNTLNIRRNG